MSNKNCHPVQMQLEKSFLRTGLLGHLGLEGHLGDLALELRSDGRRGLKLLVDVPVHLPEVVEVLDGLDLEFGGRRLVHDKGGAWVLLQRRHGPHVAHALLHRLFTDQI